MTVSEQDLRQVLARYRAAHPSDVLTIDERLDRDQDLTALAFALEAAGRSDLMICRNVDGLSVPVVTNMFANADRIAWLLGATRDDLHSTFVSRVARPIAPRYVADGPICHQVLKGG